ncbi:hypothetical protein LDENG_00244440 [Lucifuga dentata]|nr:hypothetical protein LDENG_00244440 [Lucifuga dentata]
MVEPEGHAPLESITSTRPLELVCIDFWSAEDSRNKSIDVLISRDQGANFESELINELLRVSGIKKSHTTPYHPMGNGSVERFNRTLGGMIRELPPEAKADWPRRLQTLTFMYNCTAQETTGYPPFYLMFGQIPCCQLTSSSVLSCMTQM